MDVLAHVIVIFGCIAMAIIWPIAMYICLSRRMQVWKEEREGKRRVGVRYYDVTHHKGKDEE